MPLVVVVAAFLLAQPSQAAQPGQPKGAQEWFDAMEKKITAAKTLKIATTVKVEGAAKVDGEMTLILAEGNKLRMKATSKGPDQNDSDEVISNGIKTVSDTTAKKQGKTTRDTEKDLNAKCLKLLLRAGVFTAVDELTMPGSQPKIEHLTLENWKQGAAERVGKQAAQTIEYDCKIKDVPVPLKCKLWIDADTLVPLKRTLFIAGGGLEYRYTEMFTEVILNGEVPAKTFELPR